jgi:hypothetical protein
VSDSRFALSEYAGHRSAQTAGLSMSTLLRAEQDRETMGDISRAHLEHRLACSVATGAVDDMRYYLRVLVTRWGTSGDRRRHETGWALGNLSEDTRAV